MPWPSVIIPMQASLIKSNYISVEGARVLQAEYDHLWQVERPKVVQGVADAAAEGDRSENAEYIYGKKRLRELDKRLRYLAERLEKLIIVDISQVKTDKVHFGSKVTLEDEEGNIVRYQIVGPDEFDSSRSRISMDSPVGRALLGRCLNDEITVSRPRGEISYTVIKIA